MRRIAFTSSPDGYFLFDSESETAIGVSWSALSEDRYVSDDSLADGSWAIEAYRTSSENESTPFLIYWLYPFSHRVHRWTLDVSGRRVDGRDLSPDATRRFLLQRADEGPIFITRLFLCLAGAGDLPATSDLPGRICSLALHAEQEDALLCVCEHSDWFRPDAVEAAVGRVLELVRLAHALGPPARGLGVWDARLKAFSAAVAQTRSPTRNEVQKQIELAEDLREVMMTAKAHGAPAHRDLMGRLVLHRLSQDAMGAICSPIQKPELVFSIAFSPDASAPMQVHRAVSSGMPHRRLLDCIAFMYVVLQREAGRPEFIAHGEAHGIHPHERRAFLFQAWDAPSETVRPSVSFERSVGNTGITLVPDIYYFNSHGYRDLATAVATTKMAWTERRNAFVWRGSTTGNFINTENFDTLPRYRLCHIGRSLGDVFDAGITEVVQTASAEQRAAIEARLRQEGLLVPYMPQAQMGEYRYVIDIDGNSNSWGCFAKLLLGACVVKVESPFEQWFYPDLEPWKHYVPVAKDLSDLATVAEWCLSHPDESAKIALAGRHFALERHFDRENKASAYAILAASEPV